MAKRASASRPSGIDARLRAATALAEAEAAPDLGRRIAEAIADPAGVVAAAGVRAAVAHRQRELAPAIAEALDRAYGGEDAPAHERDPQCHAKRAAIGALDDWSAGEEAVFIRAATHVQPEPVWGGRSDSAGPLRVRALQALASRWPSTALRIGADLLADPLGEVRVGAAEVVAHLGGEGPALLLRLRLRLGDAEHPEHVGDYAAALLAADGPAGIPPVAALLAHVDLAIAEGAALALGGSRLPEALPPLLAALDATVDGERRQGLVTAIALQRSEAAVEVLLRLVAEAPPALAALAAGTGRFLADRPVVAERLRQAAARRGGPVARAAEAG